MRLATRGNRVTGSDRKTETTIPLKRYCLIMTALGVVVFLGTVIDEDVIHHLDRLDAAATLLLAALMIVLPVLLWRRVGAQILPVALVALYSLAAAGAVFFAGFKGINAVLYGIEKDYGSHWFLAISWRAVFLPLILTFLVAVSWRALLTARAQAATVESAAPAQTAGYRQTAIRLPWWAASFVPTALAALIVLLGWSQRHPLPPVPSIVGRAMPAVSLTRLESGSTTELRTGNPYQEVLLGDNQTTEEFLVDGYPDTYAIDRAGIVRGRHGGPLTAGSAGSLWEAAGR